MDPRELREHVVCGADFFDAGRHPAIAFSSADVELREDGTATVAGELMIKGITRPIVAEGVYVPPVEDPFGSRRGALELTATIDRRDWDMTCSLRGKPTAVVGASTGLASGKARTRRGRSRQQSRPRTRRQMRLRAGATAPRLISAGAGRALIADGRCKGGSERLPKSARRV
jgi:hypothetical protein